MPVQKQTQKNYCFYEYSQISVWIIFKYWIMAMPHLKQFSPKIAKTPIYTQKLTALQNRLNAVFFFLSAPCTQTWVHLQRRDICPTAVGFYGAGGVAQCTKPRWNMRWLFALHHMEYPGTECIIYIYSGAQSFTLGSGVRLLRNATAYWSPIRS